MFTTPDAEEGADVTLDNFLSRLKNVRSIRGGWVARCPTHDDRNPSLSISENDGRILLKCHAGCETSAILAALGLKMSDLFTRGEASGGSKRIIAAYDYVGENGKLLFQVVRYDPKAFRQRRPDGAGGWLWNLDGARHVLYNLPAVINSDNILLLEGEKDCHAAARLGLVATTNPGGAGKWRPEYSEALRGKHVTIICDADAPGLAHGRDVARSLVGVAASVKLTEALAQAKDVTEWLELGDGDLEGAREQLLEIIGDTAVLTAADIQTWQAAKLTNGYTLTPLRELLAEPEEEVSWLLEGVLPGGGLSLLAAKPKTGKSTLARCLALAVARGEPFLGRATFRGPVIYLALEEKRSEVRSHFQAMGATGEEDICVHAAHAPADALPAISGELETRRPVLLIVDPLLRFARVKDSNDYAQVTAALEPILILARGSGAHVLLVHHLGKGERAEATDGILGSTALFAAVDTALVMKRYANYRTVQSRQRYGIDLGETTLQFDAQSRTLSLGAERADAETQSATRNILEFLQAAGEVKTEPEIVEAVESETRIFRRALRDLVKQGSVSREGAGKRGSPYRYGFSFSRSEDIVQTSKQETKKPPQTSINTDRNLVPASEQKSFLVRENTGAEKPVLSARQRAERDPLVQAFLERFNCEIVHVEDLQPVGEPN